MSPSSSQPTRRLLMWAGFILPILLTCTLGWFARSARHSGERSAAEVSRTLQIKNELSNLLSAVLDAETGQRGFMLTSDSEHLRTYQHGVSGIASSRQALEGLIIDAQAKDLLVQLDPKLLAKQTFMAETVKLSQQKNPEAQQRVASGKGRLLMDAIRVHLGELNAREDTLLYERQAREAKHAVLSEVLSWSIFAIALGAVTGAIFLLKRLRDTQHFIKMCAFSGTFQQGSQWVSVEQLLEDRYNTVVSHGISPAEAQRVFGRSPKDSDTSAV